MELSGLIFVALAVVWAVVLIPKALRHHDEVARTRSVDEVSADLRVLARTGPPPAPAPSIPNPRLPVDRAPAGRPLDRLLAAQRLAAARAARRRRRVLLLLVAVTAGVGGAAGAGLLLPWAPAVPGAVILAFLVTARFMVRREHARWDRTVAELRRTTPAAPVIAEPAPAPKTPVPAPAPRPVAPAVVSGLDDTSSLSVELLASASTAPAAELWDPVPVTLPTYVSKPRATRSVRTIDLRADGVSSSGRDAAASALVASAASDAAPDEPEHRAVGS